MTSNKIQHSHAPSPALLALTSDQASILREHLEQRVAADYVVPLLSRIDEECAVYRRHLERHKTTEWTDFDREIEQAQDRLNGHHTGGPRLHGATYWNLFYHLGYLLECRDRGRHKRYRGRPRNDIRRMLIQGIRACYVDHIGRKPDPLHFKKTIKLVLGFLGAIRFSDLNEVIRDALCGIE